MAIPDKCLLYVDAAGVPGHDGGEATYFDGTEAEGAERGSGRYTAFPDRWELGAAGAELALAHLALLAERTEVANRAPGPKSVEGSGPFGLRNGLRELGVPPVREWHPTDRTATGAVFGAAGGNAADAAYPGRAVSFVSGLFSARRTLERDGAYFDPGRGNLHRPARLAWSAVATRSWRKRRTEAPDGTVETESESDGPETARTTDRVWGCGGLSDGMPGADTLRLQLYEGLSLPLRNPYSSEESESESEPDADADSAFGESTAWHEYGFDVRRRPQDGDGDPESLDVGEPEGTVRPEGGDGRTLRCTQPVRETLLQARRILAKVRDFVACPKFLVDCSGGVLGVSGEAAAGRSGSLGFEAGTKTTETTNVFVASTAQMYESRYDEDAGDWTSYEQHSDPYEVGRDRKGKTVDSVETRLVGQSGPFVVDPAGSRPAGIRWSGGFGAGLSASVSCTGQRTASLSREKDGRTTCEVDEILDDPDYRNMLFLTVYTPHGADRTETRETSSLGDHVSVNGVVPESGTALRVCLMSATPPASMGATQSELPPETVGTCTVRSYESKSSDGTATSSISSTCDDVDDGDESWEEPWDESSGSEGWMPWDDESSGGEGWIPWDDESSGGEPFARDESWWDESTGESDGGDGESAGDESSDCGPGWPASPLMKDNGLGRHVRASGTAIVAYSVEWTIRDEAESTRFSAWEDSETPPSKPGEGAATPPRSTSSEEEQAGRTEWGVAVVTRSYPWKWDDKLGCGVFDHPPMDLDFIKDIAAQAGMSGKALEPPKMPEAKAPMASGDYSSVDATETRSHRASVSVSVVKVFATGSLGDWPGD